MICKCTSNYNKLADTLDADTFRSVVQCKMTHETVDANAFTPICVFWKLAPLVQIMRKMTKQLCWN